MKFAIVTGASRGLGEEVAKLALSTGYNLLTVARKPELNTVEEEAKRNQKEHFHFATDLSDPDKTASIGEKMAAELTGKDIDELLLVNNAGMVTPISPIGHMDSQQISAHVSLNITAPMILLNEIKKTVTDIPLTVVNISSGAAERGTYGWSAYGSTKAAVNLYTQTAALEAKELNLDEVHVAFSPGIMDTEMQSEIRKTTKQAFKDVEKFQNFKSEGQLRSPKEVADLLFKLLKDRSSIRSGHIYRVYDLVDKE